MFKMNRMLGGALIAFALIVAPMARADDEKPVKLLVTPKVGQATRSKTIIKTNVQGSDVVVTQIQTQTVKDVKENGDVVVETTVESTTVEFGGASMDQPAPPPVTITRDKFGKVTVSKETENQFMAVEIAKIMTSLSRSILTDKAVKTNDTWQTELENPAVKEKKILVKGTYLGMEKIDGTDYWKIKQTAEAIVAADGSKLVSESTEWINPADGTVVKTEGTLKDVPTAQGTLTMELSTKAVKADAKADVKADAKDKPTVAKP